MARKARRSRRLSLFIALASSFILSGCAYMPLTHIYERWAFDSCGRKTLAARGCSELVSVLTSPAYLVTWTLDYPLSTVEFLTGVQAVKDPLLNKSAYLDFEKKTFAGIDGEI